MKTTKKDKEISRKKRVRAKIKGSALIPRLAVRITGLHTYAQIIDDEKGVTLVSASDLSLAANKDQKPIEIAKSVGKEIAEAAKAKRIKKVVFDRGSRLYHGNVKTLAESARENGLDF